MRRWIAERPWIWVLVALGLVVAANGAMLWVAQSSHGPDLLQRP